MPSRWTMPTALAALVVVVFLIVQLAVPVAGLFARRPSPFAWHMYSAMPQLPQVWLVDSAGIVTLVDVRDYFAGTRAEIDYAAVARAGLCDVTDAAAIRLQAAPNAEAEEIACH